MVPYVVVVIGSGRECGAMCGSGDREWEGVWGYVWEWEGVWALYGSGDGEWEGLHGVLDGRGDMVRVVGRLRRVKGPW